MFSCSVKAYGKINICLKVEEKKGDYHPLDSIVVTVNKYDVVKVSKRRDEKILLTFLGKYAPPTYIQEETNAYKACKLFMDKYSTCGVNLEIERNIPTGSGMGGSSADISGVLLAMQKLFGIKDDLKEMADNLGSDSGYLLKGGFARLQGRGEIVTPIKSNAKWYVILVYAKNGVNTKDCFETFDKIGDEISIDIDKCILAVESENLSLLKGSIGNSLEKSACLLNEEVALNLQNVKNLSPDVYGMTGSGSTVFVMYDSYEMASWAYSKLKKIYANRIDLVETYNPDRVTLIDKIMSYFSFN